MTWLTPVSCCVCKVPWPWTNACCGMVMVVCWPPMFWTAMYWPLPAERGQCRKKYRGVAVKPHFLHTPTPPHTTYTLCLITTCRKVTRFVVFNSNIYSHVLIIRALTVTLTLKMRSHFFLQDIQANDDISLYQVRLQKIQRFRRYHPDNH